jgi:hypothetical protein
MKASMLKLSLEDLALVVGGAGTPQLCTPSNPQGKAPQQYMETSHAGPSMNQRVMDATNTGLSRAMSMVNDGRPTLPKEW